MKKSFITFIRLAVGWHFLYEGLTKLLSENWTSEGYLSSTFGTFSGFYQWLAASPVLVHVVDFLNIWGLILIGLALTTGLVIRWASLSGVLLLALYYFAYPPFGTSMPVGDGNYYIVDKNFIEAVILLFYVFSSEKGYGLQNLITMADLRKRFSSKNKETEPQSGERKGRREVLKNLATLPVLGALGWGASKTFKWYGMDVFSGATIQLNRLNINELKGELPKGKIKNTEISRLIMGGNLIGGWAHARDLIYAESLFKAYNTEKKIFDTLMLCEQAGVNAMNIGFVTMPLLVKYKKITGSKLNVTVQVALDKKNNDVYDNVTRAIDSGMDMIQLQGNQCDWLSRDGDFDTIATFMDRIRSQGYPAGLGAHTIDSLILCEEHGIIPDFYMKTMHHDRYWSAHIFT